MKYIVALALVCFALNGMAQMDKKTWVNAQFKKLTPDEKIAQLMIIRLSEIGEGGKVTFFDERIRGWIKKYNIGGLCVFQGGPTKQAALLNEFQGMAKTPLMMCIDAEWGLGMRLLDSVAPLPRQMMLGAMQNENLVYRYGVLLAKQCKRMGIQVNYAPVVDVNNNPANPVINDRSFGEDKYTVAKYGIAVMKGMQDNAVIACAKHFPGHGDVSVDSHYDLPIINKSIASLDSLEFYPFKEIFKAGVGSVMVAHLSIPAIDKTPNKPTSISYKNVTELMRKKMGYQGLTFTDALNMKGVAKFYPAGVADVESLIAGNDMLCLPEDVPTSIAAIKKAIANKKLSWKLIDEKVKKVLEAKYTTGLNNKPIISVEKLQADLNEGIPELTREIAQEAITFLPKDNELPIAMPAYKKKALVCIGTDKENSFARSLKNNLNADVFYFDYKKPADSIAGLLEKINAGGYEFVITAVHGHSNRPAKNFMLSDASVSLFTQVQTTKGTHLNFNFGNPYALNVLGKVSNMYQCYDDKAIVQEVAAELIYGIGMPKGRLPVSLKEYKLGEGWSSKKKK